MRPFRVIIGLRTEASFLVRHPSRVALTLHQRDGGVRLLARHRSPHRVDGRHRERVDGVGLQVVYGVARPARVGHRLLLQPLELGAVLDADRAPSEERRERRDDEKTPHWHCSLLTVKLLHLLSG